MKKILAFTAYVVLCIVCVKAQSPDIVKHITSDGENTVVQPRALYMLLLSDVSVSDVSAGEQESGVGNAKTSRQSGFRIQVFSDNNSKTAKNEARSKSREISARFPSHRTYVIYTSPYWRLKVGDFRTQAEADEFAEELRNAFPKYAKEIRVVRDKINL